MEPLSDHDLAGITAGAEAATPQVGVDEDTGHPQAAGRAPRIDLMRHAESEMNLAPGLIGGRSNHTPLSPHGRAKAVEVGRELAASGYRPTALYCSPAVRTIQTAQLVSGGAGWELELQIDDRLQELSQGDAEGQPRDEWWTPETIADMRADPAHHRLAPNGENHREVQLRMRAALDDIARRHPGGTVLVVSHGVAMRTLLWSRDGGSHEDGFRKRPLDNLAMVSWQR